MADASFTIYLLLRTSHKYLLGEEKGKDLKNCVDLFLGD